VSGADSRADAILHGNLDALAGRFPELASIVAGASELELEARAASSGEASARNASGAWLHSSRDPRAEAKALAAAVLGSASGSAACADKALLLGLGLGYGAEACLEAGAESVVVCEADAASLKAAFRMRDMRALLADERFGLVVGGEPEGVISALELSGGNRAGILEIKAVTSAFPEWFERARAAAGRWNAKGAVNENTLQRFGRLWVRNLARNLNVAASSPGVERLEGLFAGSSGAAPIPALVLAAGPSLDLVLPHIREISRRALVVCVDTALRSLLRFGVEPDFLVVVDPQYWNWRHLAGLESPLSFLVSEAAAWPAVFRSSHRGTFLGGSLFPLGRRIEAFAGEKGRLGAGGSVATSAWDLCRIMGCGSVWMAGLDLSYPGGRTHAAASLFEQRALASGCRLSPASSAQAAALVGGHSYDAPSANGGSVRTDQRMSLYAWWFESRFTRPLSPPTISLCPDGLAIPGFLQGRLDDLLASPERRSEIEERLARAAAMRPREGSREEAAAGLAELRGRLEHMERASQAAQAAARCGREAFSSGGDCSPSLAALDRADAEVLGLEDRDIAGFLLPSLRELAGRKARDLGESFSQSEVLYRALAESARYHLDVLSQA
jgi:hypothetical protein